MRRAASLALLALPLMAASPPQRAIVLAMPSDATFGMAPVPYQATRPGSGGSAFQPAPLPNRDASAPAPDRATNEPSLAPTLFTNKTQFRGDGFSAGSTAQSEQEKNVRPGAGFKIKMPFAPQ